MKDKETKEFVLKRGRRIRRFAIIVLGINVICCFFALSFVLSYVLGIGWGKNPYVVGIIPSLINNFLGGLF